MLNMRPFILLFIIPALYSCGEVQTKDEISANQTKLSYIFHVASRCYYEYINNYQRINGYPYKNRDFDTAFAFASDTSFNGSEFHFCGFASPLDVKNGYIVSDAPFDDIANVAIARCEANKEEVEKSITFKAPCKILARGTSIVWEQFEDIGLQSGSNKAKGRWY
jgi:hypothetical protein